MRVSVPEPAQPTRCKQPRVAGNQQTFCQAPPDAFAPPRRVSVRNTFAAKLLCGQEQPRRLEQWRAQSASSPHRPVLLLWFLRPALDALGPVRLGGSSILLASQRELFLSLPDGARRQLAPSGSAIGLPGMQALVWNQQPRF